MSYKDLQAANKISIEAIARIAKRMTPEQITAARERAQKLLSDRRGADAQNATIVTVPRTRLEGAPQGLVNVPSDRTGAVLSSDRSEEEMAEEDTGPKLPSLTPLN